MIRAAKQVTPGRDEARQNNPKRTRIALSFSPEELQQVRQGAGATPLAAWCKNRILLSDGFGDPMTDFVSQGLMAAAALRQYQYLYIGLFELGYQLKEALHDAGDPHQDARLKDLIDKLDGVLGQVCEDHEQTQASQQLLAESLIKLRRLLTDRPIGDRASQGRRS